MLREVGRVVREHLRKSDMACRYSDKEFVLVLESTARGNDRANRGDPHGSARLEVLHGAERLTGPVKSAGVATFGEDGTTAQALLNVACAAAQRAKRAGNDRVVLYDNQEKT